MFGVFFTTVVPEDVLRYYLMYTDRTDFCPELLRKMSAVQMNGGRGRRSKLNEIVQNSSPFMPLTATDSHLQEEKYKDKQMKHMMKKKNDKVFLKT